MKTQTRSKHIKEWTKAIRLKLGEVRLTEPDRMIVAVVGSQEAHALMEAVARFNKELADSKAEFRITLMPSPTMIEGRELYGTICELSRRPLK